MAGLTYGAQTGIKVESFLVEETSLGDQTQQSGNNQVVVSDDITTLSKGQIGDGTNGIGASYTGRLMVKNIGLTSQEVKLTKNEAAGTGNTYILTGHENWITPPVATDTLDVCYELADILDGLGSGIGLNTKTGLWELGNYLTIGDAVNKAGLQVMAGQALEQSEEGSSIATIIEIYGRLFYGYKVGDAAIGPAVLTSYNGTAGEPNLQAKSGSYAYIYSALLWAQKIVQQMEFASGANVFLEDVNFIKNTQELIMYGVKGCIKGKVAGQGGTAEIVRVSADTVVNGLALENIDSIDSAADTTTETITLRGVIDGGITDIITLRNNKTYNMISTQWSATSHSDFNSALVTGSAAINDLKAIAVTVQKADGTKVASAKVYMYENTILDDVQSEVTADSDGVTDGSFELYEHSWTTGTGSTTTYGGHAFIAAPWLYTPFIAAQVSTEDRLGSVIVALDPYISETTLATATSAGSGVTINEDTNPSELAKHKLGSGSILPGMILTFSGGGVGTVTELMSGDSTAGYFHMKDRNATAIGNDETFSRTGGTAGTFSGTFDNVKYAFTKWIGANSVSFQSQHDYFLALLGAATVGTDGKKIVSWMRDSQAKILFADGSKFYTERSYSKGVIVVDAGAGSIDHFTADDGTTWTPPVSITTTLAANVSLLGAEIAIYDLDITPPDFGTELSHIESNTGANYQFSGNATNVVKLQIMLAGYEEYLETWSIPAVDSTKTVKLEVETN